MSTRAATVRKFRQAARQRLTTAEFLLRHKMYIDAEYLGGYAVECALKGLILARTSDRRFAATWNRISKGQKAHDYETLKGILTRGPINVTFPAAVMGHFRRVGSWSTALRYEVGRGDPTKAALFVEAAREIVRWAEGVL